MHDTCTKRLYLGGLARDVTSEEIHERFSRFGKVSNLSLKQRVDESGNKVKVFAHLDLEGDEVSIKKCFSTYQNTKWKGSTLQLQFAKESFLQKLEKERQATRSEEQAEPDTKPSTDIQEPAKSQSELFEVKRPAVPGTPVPGKKDWVVGKYGRALPVLKLKKSYKIKMVKYDPSKHCHAVRIFKDDKDSTLPDTSCDKLTWEIDTPDTEITKKRKGEFPNNVSQSCKKMKGNFQHLPLHYTPSRSGVSYLASESSRNDQQLYQSEKEFEDLEIVKVGSGNSNLKKSLNKSNKFDSDVDSDSEVVSLNLNASSNEKKVKLSVSQLDRKSSHVKSVSTAKKDCGITTSLTANKEDENQKSEIFIDNKEKKTHPEKKALSTDRNTLSAGKKVPEFKGLGMLAIFPHDFTTAKAESGLTVHTDTGRSSDHKSVVNSTHQVNVTHVYDAQRTLHQSRVTSPSGKLNNIVESSDLKMISNQPSSNKNMLSVTKIAQGKSPQKRDRQDSLPKITSSIHDNGKLSLKENKHLSSSILSNDVSPSFKENSSSINYDSSSSADTDEIISRHRRKMDLTSSTKAKTEVTSDGLRILDKPGISPSQTRIALKENTKASLTDHSMCVSEFTAGIPEMSDISLPGPGSVSDSHDSYDSDLDSNDFELVAKKLAQKTASSEMEILHKKKPEEKTKSSKVEDVIHGLPLLGPQMTPAQMQSPESEDEGRKRLRVNTKKDMKKKTVNPDLSRPAPQKTVDVAHIKSTGPDQGMSVKPSQMSAANTSRKASYDVSKHAADNEKRLQAIRENMRLRQLQQSVCQTALKNVDSQSSSLSKRVVFSSSDDDDEDDNDASVGVRTAEDSRQEKSMPALFDSQDEDEDYDRMFKSKLHFEGEKGERLMRLEQKIGDPRFKLDAKFAVSDSEDETEETPRTTETATSLDNEKAASLQVLEKVIGKATLDRFSEKLKRNTKQIIDMNSVRFDPTKIQSKAEISPSKDVKPQNKIKLTPQAHKEKHSDKIVKMKVKEEVQKTNEESKKEGKKNQIKSVAEVNSSSLQNGAVNKKKESETKLKSETTNTKSKNSADSEKKSRIQLSSSLADLFKKRDQAVLENEETETFSLLKKFDENARDDDDSNEDGDTDFSEQGIKEKSSGPLSALFNRGRDKPTAPLSALFKETKDKVVPANKSANSVKSASEFSEDSSDDEMSVESAGDEEKDELDVMGKQDSVTVDGHTSEDEDSSEDDSSKEECSDRDERSLLAANNADEHETELMNAGRMDVRYTKEMWLKRWEDIRPVLVKMYKRKHTDALKNKIKQSEMKRRKQFLKKSRRKTWNRKKVS